MEKFFAESSLETTQLILFATTTLLSLSPLTKVLWKYRRFFAYINCVAIGMLVGIFATAESAIFGFLFLFIQAYRVIILLRIAQNRINSVQLRHITKRSEAVLLSATGVILILSSIEAPVSLVDALLCLAIVQLIVGVVLYRHSTHTLGATTAPSLRKHLADDELPTLTVAIPARNETNELTDCLENILESNYPKLEILVLDDCSQDKTSDIIRSFAHRGVRFLKGVPPPAPWVAKTYAYQQLLDNSSGDVLLFCGTDVRMDKAFLRQLVEIMTKNKLKMLSVLPKRNDAVNGSYLLQPMRYWRELAIPRTIHKSPSVLSTCWIVDKHHLEELGGFHGLRQNIRPERAIALATKMHYRFLRASDDLALFSVKSLEAQWNTAIRTRYPELHRRPETIAFTTAWYFLFLFGPVLTLLGGLSTLNGAIITLSAASSLLLILTQVRVYKMITDRKELFAAFLLPYNVVLEIIAINYSMWAYEFGSVIWRGRNICLPVVDIVPKLPKT